ncbi:MAG: ASKHA domain-containing protein, partial [Candidatus Latescibacterota bacterium]
RTVWLMVVAGLAVYYRAARTRVRGPMRVEVPPESRVEREQILTEGVESWSRFLTRVEEGTTSGMTDRGAAFAHSPLTTRYLLQLPPPTASDNISDLERLRRGIRQAGGPGHAQVSLAEVRRLGRLLRRSDWQVTVTLGERDGVPEVVAVEPGDTSERNWGVAVDVGTTTVVASLVELGSGRTAGTEATHNRQILHGHDVITRIVQAEKEGGLETLQRAVVDTINELIEALVTEAGITPQEVTGVTCAGNTTMIHLLLRLSPSYLRRAPYVPMVSRLAAVHAVETGLKVHPRALVDCLPAVSSFVGGDITAGVLASGLDQAERPCMLIDLGTNGEIVLGNREWLVCCSASAGTAFEGSGVRCGARAVQGVAIDPETFAVACDTVGDEAPIGICGSGFIDLLAELFGCGLIDRQGKLQAGAGTPRIRQGRGGLEFVVVWAEGSGTGWDIAVSQATIDNLVRAKGAIYSGAKVLVDKVGLRFEEIERIFVGGGFGNHLDIDKAVRIGLLPDLPEERFQFIGNSSLAGARMALLSRQAATAAHQIAGRMTNLELCEEPTYMGEYVGSLFLPHTDIDLFPTVKQHLVEMDPCPARSR